MKDTNKKVMLVCLIAVTVALMVVVVYTRATTHVVMIDENCAHQTRQQAYNFFNTTNKTEVDNTIIKYCQVT